jgi:hypothetical protein
MKEEKKGGWFSGPWIIQFQLGVGTALQIPG